MNRLLIYICVSLCFRRNELIVEFVVVHRFSSVNVMRRAIEQILLCMLLSWCATLAILRCHCYLCCCCCYCCSSQLLLLVVKQRSAVCFLLLCLIPNNFFTRNIFTIWKIDFIPKWNIHNNKLHVLCLGVIKLLFHRAMNRAKKYVSSRNFCGYISVKWIEPIIS